MNSVHPLDAISIITASIAFTITISWNNLFNEAITDIFPSKDKSLTAKTLYTIILTVSASILLYYLSKYYDNVKNLIKFK